MAVMAESTAESTTTMTHETKEGTTTMTTPADLPHFIPNITTADDPATQMGTLRTSADIPPAPGSGARDRYHAWRQLVDRYEARGMAVPVTTGHVLAAIDADDALASLAGLITVTGEVLPRWRSLPYWRDGRSSPLISDFDVRMIEQVLEHRFFGVPILAQRVHEALQQRAEAAARHYVRRDDRLTDAAHRLIAEVLDGTDGTDAQADRLADLVEHHCRDLPDEIFDALCDAVVANVDADLGERFEERFEDADDAGDDQVA